ncbi:MAG: hypothetical protein NC434_08215 [Ruminococcus sp.]|nr:hypothetical protein [Ruminococcus sp.]
MAFNLKILVKYGEISLMHKAVAFTRKKLYNAKRQQKIAGGGIPQCLLRFFMSIGSFETAYNKKTMKGN